MTEEAVLKEPHSCGAVYHWQLFSLPLPPSVCFPPQSLSIEVTYHLGAENSPMERTLSTHPLPAITFISSHLPGSGHTLPFFSTPLNREKSLIVLLLPTIKSEKLTVVIQLHIFCVYSHQITKELNDLHFVFQNTNKRLSFYCLPMFIHFCQREKKVTLL